MPLTDDFNQKSEGPVNPSGSPFNIVPFRYILQTGTVQGVAESYVDSVQKTAPDKDTSFARPMTVDWKADDSFIRALDEVEQNVKARIHMEMQVKLLLEENSWKREDRVTWERDLSRIVSEEVTKIPGLGSYRSELFNPETTARHTHLNDLSADIDHETQDIEFDCEQMSFVEGTILQRVEDEFLPAAADNPRDFKQAASYYYAAAMHYDAGDKDIMAHAFILSAATGNIIEATANTAPGDVIYKENFYRNDIQHMLDGSMPFFTGNEFYGNAETVDDAKLFMHVFRIDVAEMEMQRLHHAIEHYHDMPEVAQAREAIAAIDAGARDPELQDMTRDLLRRPNVQDARNAIMAQTQRVHESMDSLTKADAPTLSDMPELQKRIENLVAQNADIGEAARHGKITALPDDQPFPSHAVTPEAALEPTPSTAARSKPALSNF